MLMLVPFPFELPAPTAFYLSLYVLTFALHQAFMHYVLAGSLYIAFVAVRPGTESLSRTEQPLAATLRDWMPFLLSAAITAGVAPLLFIQIVYQTGFYTANLLLWWRWMLVVPVLIVAFYLLYLLKSSMLWHWPYAVRAVVTIGTAACFVFVGFCWTANHLLANNESSWPEVYATGRFPLVASIVVSRMLVWIGGSFATMSVIVGWQLLHRQRISDEPALESDISRLAWISHGGIWVAMLAGILYFTQCGHVSRSLLLSTSFMPYLIATVCGVAGQWYGWGIQSRLKRLGWVGLSIASAGCGLCLVGTSFLREGIRVSDVDVASMAERHRNAAAVGGFPIFVVALAVVAALIAWCVRLVQHGMNDQTVQKSEHP